MSRRITPPVLPRVAALYCRVSTKKQAGDGLDKLIAKLIAGETDDDDDDPTADTPGSEKTSLKTQLEALIDKAGEMGYAVTPERIYWDAFSGEELHQRPALSKLREDARTGAFGLVLAYNVYALAKNQTHIAILLDEFEHAGVQLDFVTESLENTPLGRLVMNARAFAAEVEGERRRDRMQRALLATVNMGRMAPGPRATYGYAWPNGPEHYLPNGTHKRDGLVRHPQTWPLLERIWAEALAGHTQHAIAARLASEGVLTPSGRGTAWNHRTIGQLLDNPLYWGEGLTLRSRYVPVEPSVRHLYKHKSRAIVRAQEEQVLLPPAFAPAVVTPEEAAQVHRLMELNKRLATPNNPHPQELLRGAAVCGYCGRRLIVAHLRKRADGSGRVRSSYRCPLGNDSLGACTRHSIEAHTFDNAVWAEIVKVFQHPEQIEEEVEDMKTQGDPAVPTLEAIERQLAEIRRQIANKRKYIDLATDDREIAEVAAEVTALRKQERDLEAERGKTTMHFADWQATQDGLIRLVDYAARVAGHLERFTFEQRRETVMTLKTAVKLYRSDHTPRWEGWITLPLSGTLRLPTDVHMVGCAS